eukprot:5371812-Ditylum_brightwellii.AAC.1
MVYFLFEEATQGTSYAASVKPKQRKKDGRSAWQALIAHYAGKDKWEKLYQDMEDVLYNRQWKGTGNFKLDQLVAQHRNAF